MGISVKTAAGGYLECQQMEKAREEGAVQWYMGSPDPHLALTKDRPRREGGA